MNGPDILSSVRVPRGSLVGLCLAALCLPATLIAQDRVTPQPRGTVRGVVYDALSGRAIAGATVMLDDEQRGVLADSAGVFFLDDVAPGPQLLWVDQFGYQERGVGVTVPGEPGDFVEVELIPEPIMLDGVTAVVDNIQTMNRRLTTRRKAAPTSTWAFEQERLIRSASGNVLEFLRFETFVRPIPCTGRTLSNLCVIRRGRVVEPRLYIDEVPTYGLHQLETYATSELYLVEIFSAGAEIRAYTKQFMERMAKKPIALHPVFTP